MIWLAGDVLLLSFLVLADSLLNFLFEPCCLGWRRGGVFLGETTSAILDWANALQDRVDHLVVKNKVAGDDFSYLFESEPGQRFLQLARPAIIEMERRLPDIQQELNDRGLSLRQALEAPAEIAGPVLSKLKQHHLNARLSEHIGSIARRRF
jgi:hypothetical protein